MEVFWADSSPRRWRGTSPAAISSTARWRSSIRAWSETAKSTRSPLPPPRRTAWPSRSRRTRVTTHTAASSASTAAAAAPIAIQAAVALEKSTSREPNRDGPANRRVSPVRLRPQWAEPPRLLGRRLRDGEDDRVVRRVVVGLRLALHRLHLDLDLRRLDLGLPEAREGDRPLFAGIDEADVLALRDVGLAGLDDRERDRDVGLLRVPRVLDRDLDGQVRAQQDRGPLRGAELRSLRHHLDRHEVRAVEPALGRRDPAAADPAQHRLHRSGGG